MSEKILKSIQLNNHDYVIDAKYLGGKDISDIENCVKITYEGLKHLKNLSKLIPGKQYRITDYITSTSQEYTISAGHQFDIIVTADDVNRLNEKARSIQHEGDTYFKDSNLSAWEIWYCLDNDTNRFSWASRTGKGVIYRMIDEFNNDCPYDFKNIQFARWELSNPVGYRNDYDFDNYEDNWIQESTLFDSLKTGFYGLNSSDKDFSYVYNNDDDYYKYKVKYTISESPTYCYTFGKDADYSISGSNYDGNVIKEYKSDNKTLLNNIVFLSGCSSNSFGKNCYYNTFGRSCSSNSFGRDCSHISFGENCHNNSFGEGCHTNSFGNYVESNSFGGGCSSNSFGNNCDSNSLGNVCHNNSFGNSCYYNSFGECCSSNSLGNTCYSNSLGNTCYSNSFGNDCNSNSFGGGCSSNSFGDYCGSNSFGGGCSSNSFGDYCGSNSFGNNCSNNSLGSYCNTNSFGNSCNSNSLGDYCCYNSFGNSCDYNSLGRYCFSNSFGDYCDYNNFGASRDNIKSYYRHIIFENGNSHINLNSPTTSSTHYFQNVRIALGANNNNIQNATYTNLTINDSNVDQAYETVYGKIIVANQIYMRDESL